MFSKFFSENHTVHDVEKYGGTRGAADNMANARCMLDK